MPILQGTNWPITIIFDAEIDNISKLIVSLWDCSTDELLKSWKLSEVIVDGNTITCPLSEEESRGFNPGKVKLEAKGLDEDDKVIFWDDYTLSVLPRNDRIFVLRSQTGETP